MLRLCHACGDVSRLPSWIGGFSAALDLLSFNVIVALTTSYGRNVEVGERDVIDPGVMCCLRIQISLYGICLVVWFD